MSEKVSEPQAVGTNLSIFDRFDNPLEAIDKMGEWFARSGMFRCGKVEQGKVLALACLVERRNPLEIMREYHVMEDGTLTMRADAIQAKFENDGGSVEWVRTDGEVCEIRLEHPKAKKPITVKVTLQELRDSGVALGKDGTLKANYRRSTRQMLRARAISEGVRMIRPGIIVGIVTPEEAGDEHSGLNGIPEQSTKITLSPVSGAVVESVPAHGPGGAISMMRTDNTGRDVKGPPPPSRPLAEQKEPSAVKIATGGVKDETDAWAKATAQAVQPPPWAVATESKEKEKPGYKKSKAQEKAEREKTASVEAERIATVVTNAVVNAVVSAAPAAGQATPLASAPAPAQATDPIDSSTEEAAIEALFKGKEFEANQWLVDANWIAALGSYRGLRSDQRKKILAKPEAFMRAVIQKAEARGPAAPAATASG
jgi:hypothetical protein